MTELAFRQAILHALLAAAFTEALLRGWRIERAGARLSCWIVALAFPFLALPAFLITAPFRASDSFAARWALFASARWHDVRLAGLPVDTLAVTVLAFAGVALFLRDLVPFIRGALRERRNSSETQAPVPPWLPRCVAELAARASTTCPAIAVVETDTPALLVRGVRLYTIVVSTGLLTRLSAAHPDAVAGALAHEVAHVRGRDPLAGWVLMAARFLMFWNPAVQLMARAIVEEMERRADDAAACLTSRDAVIAALRCFASEQPSATLGDELHRGTLHARADALAAPATPALSILPRLTLAALTLGLLLFFVV